MAMTKLDKALFTARLGCLCCCGFLLVAFVGNGHIPVNTVSIWGLAALGIQVVVSLAEQAAPQCLGLGGPLPDHLGLSLLFILVDFLAASFVMAMGWAAIGIFIQETYNGVCQSPCKLSFVFGLLMLVGGVLGGIATLCTVAVAAKMNLQRQAQH